MPPDILEKYGIPASMVAVIYWALPKLWRWFSERMNIAGQQNDLTVAGLGGMNDVITNLRNQIADFSGKFDEMNSKLKDMGVTLDQAVAAKLLAEQDAAKARNDLFLLQLYVTKLQAQIRMMGQQPVEQ